MRGTGMKLCVSIFITAHFVRGAEFTEITCH